MKIKIKPRVKPKEAKPKKVKLKIVPEVKKRRKLSLHVVAEMFDLYCQDMSEGAIASTLGVSRTTVHKYIEEGDPAREIEPLYRRRARILHKALEIQDGKLTERAANLIQISSASAGMAGQRFIARTRAAMALDNPNLPSNERALAEKIAEEPTVQDFATFSREFQANARLAMAMTDPDTQQGVTVNVNQSQAQGASSHATGIEEGDMDVVYQHIESLAKSNPQDHSKVADLVRKANLSREADEG